MHATRWTVAIGLLATLAVAGVGLAHESYELGDGEVTLTVGDQNEPIYTYKWTNLDLILRNGTGDPVALDEAELSALDAQLEAPGGQMLDGELEGQYGEEGRYEFADGHYYTQPGQYTLHVDGEIEGVDATGTYDLPGPRQSFSDFGFPHADVPTHLDLDERLTTVEEDHPEDLQQRVEELETRIDELQTQLNETRTQLETTQTQSTEESADAPGPGAGLALGALAAVGLLAGRREG
jgi:hypothetical protein